MKKIVIGLALLVSTTNMWAIGLEVKSTIELEERLSPKGLALKRALDLSNLSLEDVDMFLKEVPKVELQRLMKAYIPTISNEITEANKNLDNMSLRKVQHLRLAVLLFEKIAEGDDKKRLQDLTNEASWAIIDHKTISQINDVQKALIFGTLTFQQVQKLLFTPLNDSSYYIVPETISQQQNGVFEKARKANAQGNLTESAFENIYSELTVYDLFGDKEAQETARTLKKQLVGKHSGSAQRIVPKNEALEDRS